MDNKITKKRIAQHFEYDWIKYILVVLVAVFGLFIIFNQINLPKKFERLDVFVACYDMTVDLDDEFMDKMRAEGDDVLQKVTISAQTPRNEYFAQLFSANGLTADVMVVPKSYMKKYDTWFLPIDDYVIEHCIPESYRDRVEYHVHTRETAAEGYYIESKNGVRYGFRVDNLPGIAVQQSPFVFDVRKVDPTLTEEDAQAYDSEFYMVLLPQSLKIGKYGEEEKYRDLTTSYDFVNYFFTKYMVTLSV